MARMIGIVICSRSNSRRVYKKPHTNINGKPILKHLIDRLEKTMIPIRVAIPSGEYSEYSYLGRIVDECGFENDPLKRMLYCADKNKFTTIIRITHDKILVDPEMILSAVTEFEKYGSEYLTVSGIPDGCGFEIINTETLRAASKFHQVEHISYAVRSVAKNTYELKPENDLFNHRYLIDYPEDIKFFEVLFAALGNDCTNEQIGAYLTKNHWATKINRMPSVTIYTCVKNGEAFISRAMMSVITQRGFSKMEYIIVDDHSTDKTNEIVARFCQSKPNCRWIRNPKNVGLSSSSNIAIAEARSKYIIRLDADDFFINDSMVSEMKLEIENSKLEILYPDNYLGDLNTIQLGSECHHVGGAAFKTSALNYLKFTDGLKGYEGLDLFQRAKSQLKYGYFGKPAFFYSQRPDSMSKTNLKEREEIKNKIMGESCENLKP